jgi:hypothetical protein
MSTERDTARIVRSWLQDGPTALPDRILDEVVSLLPSTQQRRAPWPARRFREMNSALRLAIAAAAVLGIAVVGYSLLPRNPGVGGPGATSPGPASGSPGPTADPLPEPLEVQPQGRLAPGSYVISSVGGVRITFDVPDGWEKLSYHAAVWAEGASVAFMTVDNVYVDACAGDDGLRVPPVGPSVEDLATAVMELPAWSGGSRSDATLDGYDGQLIELAAPADTISCDDGESRLFTINGTSEFVPTAGSAERDRIWMLDVGGTRLIVRSRNAPDASAVVVDEAQRIVESIRIEP